jgi:lipoate-protein ligase A
MELYFANGNNTNPYINLATEWELFINNLKDKICLFLWQNDNTVVIGANQNPYIELNLENIKKDNISIARRRTGGGAVFHDSGNLNFSFIMDKKNYDVKKQLLVVQNALKSVGIFAEVSGRNDIAINGRKFSGNAFYETKDICLHHGTLLINTDFEKMKYYLTPRQAKLKKHGVSSVESRVINLAEVIPSITPSRIATSLKLAFEEVYQKKSQTLDIKPNDEIQSLAALWQTDKYIFGKWKDFKPVLNANFDWGSVEIELNISNGKISDASISSDSLHPSSIELAKNLITGKNSNEINNMATNDNIAGDIISLVRGKLCIN